MNQKLPKNHLVRKKWEYQRIYTQGKRLHGQGFSLICLRNKIGFNRLGISIHKKLKGAVRRNRIKRIIREAFRCSRSSFPAEMDIVITIRPDFILNSPADICKAVELLTERMRHRQDIVT